MLPTTFDPADIAEISVRSPRSEQWQSLWAPDDADDKARRRAEQAGDEMTQMLLASLKMEHVAVLTGSGCSLGVGGPSMGDLWNAIVGAPSSSTALRTAKAVGYDLGNKNIEAFLSHIEAALFIKKNTTVEKFLTAAKRTVLEKCNSFLEPSKLGAHETFIHRLSRRRSRDRRLKLFTTNYDLCFERAISAIGGVAIDGFSFMVPRRYDPRYFDYDIVRRPRSGESNGNFLEGVVLLHKLHGSVNWERRDDGVFETSCPSPENACLIYPASGKYQQSYSQPYLESISQYLAALREPNTCVLVVGFGFNDDHLSEPLIAAVRSNPHLRLIVVDPLLKTKDAEKKLNRVQDQLLDLSLKGEDVWFINSSFGAFAEKIPDLKSLTPAERLMKAVQGSQVAS
jgi:hypothetical protein